MAELPPHPTLAPPAARGPVLPRRGPGPRAGLATDPHPRGLSARRRHRRDRARAGRQAEGPARRARGRREPRGCRRPDRRAGAEGGRARWPHLLPEPRPLDLDPAAGDEEPRLRSGGGLRAGRRLRHLRQRARGVRRHAREVAARVRALRAGARRQGHGGHPGARVDSRVPGRHDRPASTSWTCRPRPTAAARR